MGTSKQLLSCFLVEENSMRLEDDVEKKQKQEPNHTHNSSKNIWKSHNLWKKNCPLNWRSTKSGFYYIKKLVTQKLSTKLKVSTKSVSTKSGVDCSFSKKKSSCRQIGNVEGICRDGVKIFWCQLRQFNPFYNARIRKSTLSPQNFKKLWYKVFLSVPFSHI